MLPQKKAMEQKNTNSLKLNKLSERLYCLPFEERSDRPNLYYIKGDDYSVAVDAGNSKKHVEKFYEAINNMGFELPKYTIISHWHWDHTFGLWAINGESISSSLTHEKLIEVSKWKWTLEAMKQREETKEDIPFCTEHILVECDNLDDIKVKTTDIVVNKNTVLDLGEISLELIPRDSTHSRDSLFVYIPQEKALIVEDADCEDFYNDSIYDQKKLCDMIEFFESLDYEDHYLGHAEKESKAQALERLRECKTS